MEQQKDYNLLRPFDPEAAKFGDALIDIGGDECSFVAGPHSITGEVVVEFSDIGFILCRSHEISMAPLCWVEGKPVYKGDVLYGKWDSASPTGYVIGGVGGDGIPIHERSGCPLSDTLDKITWSKSNEKREVKLLAYLTGENLVWKRCDAEVPDFYVRVPSEDKVIEIEQPAELGNGK